MKLHGKKGYVPISIAVFPNRYNGWWFSVCLVFEHRKAVEYCIEKYKRKKSWKNGIEKKWKKDGFHLVHSSIKMESHKYLCDSNKKERLSNKAKHNLSFYIFISLQSII